MLKANPEEGEFHTSDKSQLNRRSFSLDGVASSVSLGAASAVTFITQPERVFGANDRVRVGICGLHGRGRDHIKNFAQIKDVEIAAVCDIDENIMRERVAGMEKAGIPTPKTFLDVRKLLEDKSIDAISIATPNHWHTLMGIWACQAGKDVYVEKPCSHNLWEGKQFVAAAQKYGRIVQHGTQTRSATAVRDGIKRLHEGLDRRCLHGSWALLQVAGHHWSCTRAGSSGGSKLRSLDRPGAPARIHSQSLSLQLALVLGLWKR
jgi:hypothetical protein